MKLNTEDINSTRKSVTVSVAADEISSEEKSLLKQFSSQANVKGFRPGKAPAHLIKSQYSKQIAEELNRKIVAKAYDTVVKESGLKIYGIINIENDNIDQVQDTEIKFTTDIVPEFDLPEYKGVDVESRTVEISEEDMQQAIDGMREQRAEYNKVDRKAEKTDYVKLSYEGKIGDEAIADIVPDKPIYGKQSVTWEEAGAEHSPGVRAIIDGIVGMKEGDKKTVEQKFEKDFEVAELAGKKATYDIEVQEVRQKVLPEIDEKLLKSLNVESEEQLRERVKEELTQNKEWENKSLMRKQILQTLSDKLTFDLPESAVEQETQNMLSRFLQEQINMGAQPESFEQQKDELVESARKSANDSVKTQFILSRIAEEEKIAVKNEDMQQRIMQEAMMTRTKPEDLVKELQKDRGRLEGIQRSVLLDKTLDFLLESANVKSTGGSDK